MKEGDYGATIYFNIKDQDDEPLDLTNYTSIKVILLLNDIRGERSIDDEGSTIQVEGDEEEGVVSYRVQEGDLHSHGQLKMEVEVLFEDQRYTSKTVKQIIENKL
jgi:hypothetical protein